jgi:hypothetical protein
MHIYTYQNQQYPVDSAGKLLDELAKGKSLIRIGDGEFFIMDGGGIHFQEKNKDLQQKLKIIAKTDDPNLLFVVNFFRPHFPIYMIPNKLYYHNFSRSLHISIVSKAISLFENQKVVAVHHKPDWRIKGALKKAKSLKFIIVNPVNAFNQHTEIFEQCLKEPKDTVFYFACGPTAKTLAFDLFKLGYRVLDMGRFHEKLKHKVYRRLIR